MVTDLILGTAGHIDHGKTALIKALTGVDTDRLPEEKRRGITIELGFAELVLGDVRLGIVDVPGHERFVRNMLAGATSVDLALLVVAVDDSVKPQTREHLEILRLLDLRAGVIALTKCDLADPEWIDLVEVEVRELVEGTFLSTAPVVRTSVVSGLGLDALREALATAAGRVVQSARRRQRAGPFRMAIDRAFTLPGHGAIVTGSVQSGQAQIGDRLVIEPGKVDVRVRNLQNHNRSVPSVHRGQRAAINVAGIHHSQIRRGQEIAVTGYLVPSVRLSARVDLLASAPRPLRNRARVRLHLGTAQAIARAVLLESDTLAPGEMGYAQLLLDEPVVSVWNQPFVLRNESPLATVGGGVVLDPDADKIRRRDEEKLAFLRMLSADDPIERASAALFLAEWRDWQPEHLRRTAGVDDVPQTTSRLQERGDLVDLVVAPTRHVCVHRRVFDRTCARIEEALVRLHQQAPLQTAVERGRLVRQFEFLGSIALVEAILEKMAAAGRIIPSGDRVALPGSGPSLSPREQTLLAGIVGRIGAAGFQPPTVSELQAESGKQRSSVPQLVELAAAQGDLIRVTDDIYLHRGQYGELQQRLGTRMAGGPGLTLSEIREILETTRKYAVPICEHLDQIGFTRRVGDRRVLAVDAKGDGRPA